MKDLDALKQELARDGRLQRLQAIADSTDGQRFADALDAQKIEQAARTGDTELLRQILTHELGEKLDALLHDPQQLGRIAQLASSLVGDGGETQPPSAPQPEPGFDAGQLRRMLSAVRGSGRDSASRHLLEAMKPYLAEKRRRKIDRAMKLARLASLAELAAGEMGEDDDV